MTDIDPAALRIEGGYLVERTWECTCAGPDSDYGPAHKQGCGTEPLMTVAELAALVSRNIGGRE